MYSRRVAVSVPSPRAPSAAATGEARRPFRMRPGPWEASSHAVAYSGPGAYDSSSGGGGVCGRGPPLTYNQLDAQGMTAYHGWPPLPLGAVGAAVTPSLNDCLPYPPPGAYSYPLYLSLPPSAPVPYEEAVRIAWAKDYPANCSSSSSSADHGHSFDGRQAALGSGHRREEGAGDAIINCEDRPCRPDARCEREEDTSICAQDNNSNIFNNTMRDVAGATHFEHAGITRTPSYGPIDESLSFRESQNMSGMYASRNDKVLVASTTRDANASDRSAEHSQGQWDHIDSSRSQAMRSRRPQMTIGRLTPLYRKLCEVPGCQVQPSYGLSGTSRPRFCAGHKKKGMVGLKNRPCLFPGCITRPHYGLSRGRPVYCATHKKDEMVHLLKESQTLDKGEASSRKNAEVQRHPAEQAFPGVSGMRGKIPGGGGVKETHEA